MAGGRSRKHAPHKYKSLGPSYHEVVGHFRMHADAAGIDVGANEVFVAVPADRDPEPVRSFATFTRDLHTLADWLQRCHIQSVAMESTSVYWIPLYQILETRGIEVFLVNAQHVKNVPGRKTDVSDCQCSSICTRSACYVPAFGLPERSAHFAHYGGTVAA
jgi:Transposase